MAYFQLTWKGLWICNYPQVYFFDKPMKLLGEATFLLLDR